MFVEVYTIGDHLLTFYHIGGNTDCPYDGAHNEIGYLFFGSFAS